MRQLSETPVMNSSKKNSCYPLSKHWPWSDNSLVRAVLLTRTLQYSKMRVCRYTYNKCLQGQFNINKTYANAVRDGPMSHEERVQFIVVCLQAPSRTQQEEDRQRRLLCVLLAFCLAPNLYRLYIYLTFQLFSSTPLLRRLLSQTASAKTPSDEETLFMCNTGFVDTGRSVLTLFYKMPRTFLTELRVHYARDCFIDKFRGICFKGCAALFSKKNFE